MNANICCLVCLKAFDCAPNKLEDGEEKLLSRFLKFVENHLKIPTFLKINSKSNAFCEKCELVVISPICDIYLQLLSVQLKLSWELGQLSKLMINSQSSLSDNLMGINMKALGTQFGFDNPADLEQFRSSLMAKCKSW